MEEIITSASVAAIPDPIVVPQPTPPPKSDQKKLNILEIIWKIFFYLTLAIGIGFTVCFLLLNPRQIKGEMILPIKSNQYALGERVTYLFRKPKTGEVVLFEDPKYMDSIFIGLVTEINNENGQEIFTIQSAGARPWKVTRQQIKIRIYYPSFSPEQVQEAVVSLSPTPTLPVLTPTPVQEPETVVSPLPSKASKPTATISLKPTATPTPTPTPKLPRDITLKGFAYDDTNENGVFDSVDSRLQYMQFYIYDSDNPNRQISTLYSDANGEFSITLPILGNMIVKPTTYNNFRPLGGNAELASSREDLWFGFRSVTAPEVSQSGIIEGDIFHDTNQNGIFDNGEQSIYFYKLYLMDQNNNYYLSDQGAQATDQSGHFRFTNLPIGRNYTLRLSAIPILYTVSKTDYSYNLTATQPQVTDIKIPVLKK